MLTTVLLLNIYMFFGNLDIFFLGFFGELKVKNSIDLI